RVYRLRLLCPAPRGQYRTVRTCALLATLLLLAGCGSGAGHDLAVGVGDEAARSGPPSPFLADLTRSGFDALAVSSIWDPGETAPDLRETATLRRLASAADAGGVRPFVILYQPGSATTPLTAEARSQFAAYAAAIVHRAPTVLDLIIGNEPNLNRFWLPQFGPGGENVSAAAYLRLLAATYDAVKATRDDVRVWGGATRPRGDARPAAAPAHQ